MSQLTNAKHFFTISSDDTYAELLQKDIIEDIFLDINDVINVHDTPAILRDNGKIVYIASTSELAYKYSRRILDMEKAWEANIILF